MTFSEMYGEKIPDVDLLPEDPALIVRSVLQRQLETRIVHLLGNKWIKLFEYQEKNAPGVIQELMVGH